MALTKNSICDFGWKARDFALPGTDGKPYACRVRGPKGTLVIFICNHCPYVKRHRRIVAEAKPIQGQASASSPSCRTIRKLPEDTFPT